MSRRELAGDPIDNFFFTQPAFSPDGGRIAYTLGGWPDGPRSYISPNRGGPATRIGGRDIKVQMAWSPDGQWLAYRTEAETGLPIAIRKVRVGSDAEPVELAKGTNCPPRWSPDGKRILCAGPDDIRLIPADGGAVLWRVDGFTAPAAWSRDGSAIYATRANTNEIVRLDTGTRRATPVTSLRRESLRHMLVISRFSLSPDGKTLLGNAETRETNIWIAEGIEPPRSFWGRLWPLLR